MLNQSRLAALSRSLRGKRVLSVYVDGSAADPAMQRAWRLQLEQSLEKIRGWLEDSPADERTSFERSVRYLEDALDGFEPSVGARGWAAFITADGVQDAQAVPAPVPTLATWSNGPCVAPYVRISKQSRPAVVVVADARKADLYRYCAGELDHHETVRAHHAAGHASHMGTATRPHFHTGTRGSTGHDALQRTMLRGRDRMLDEAVERVHELAGANGWIGVGGIKRVVARLAARLGDEAPDRVLSLQSLDVHASAADVTTAAERVASTLRNALDARRIEEIAEQAGAHGLGTLGPDGTRHALELTCVRDLYLTARYREEHAADAESMVREALEQDASVEEVSGSAAGPLDQRGGIAASLRFRPAALEETVAV